ncbi:MAG: hypothetical protein IJW20_01445 [Clostridia bacterium]|nr:hypothetical protein [Clostridia bacterium]
MSDKLFGVLKEVGQKPNVKVIWNTKEDLEKLIGGEIATIKCDSFTIIYKKNSDAMLANICVDVKGKGIGTSIKGRLFAVKENEKGEFYSFSNVEEATKVARFLERQGIDYTNFDEHGRYLTRAERKRRAYEEKRKRKVRDINNEIKKDDIDVSNSYFEKNFRLVPMVSSNQENNPVNLNEDASESKKDNEVTSNSINSNNKGKLVLERTPESSTTTEPNRVEPPNIVLGDESVLKMLLRIQLIILEFLRKFAEESDED